MIIFDTDLGLGTPRCEIDDGAALIQLLSLFPDDVAAITTVHGNGTLDDVLQNSCRLLSYLGREDVPLAKGAAVGLIEEKHWFKEWQAEYGETPAWDVPAGLPTAATLIVDLVRANPHQITIIAVGPLTNLALALRLAPDIEPLVKEVVTMGGSFGDVEPTPEFNAQCDPEAAHIVFSANWPLKLIGLNMTKQIPFSLNDFASLPEWNPAISLLKECAPSWIQRVTSMGWGNDDCSLHDALAVSAAADASLFSWQAMGVSVTLSGADRGVTQMHPARDGQSAVQVATGVDIDACRHLIWDHLVKAPQR